MNVQEGARRMKRAGLWLALIPVVLQVLRICIQMALIARAGIGAVVGGIGILVWAIPGTLLWIAGWIVEGFAKKES